MEEDKMRSLLIRHIGMLEVVSNSLFNKQKINYDDILSNAQEIVNIVSFIKENQKNQKLKVKPKKRGEIM